MDISRFKSIAVALSIAALYSSGCASYAGGYSANNDYGYGEKPAATKTATTNAADSIGGPISRVSTSIGEVIGGGSDGKTLYFFAKDAEGVSNCNGACAAAWPPFMVGDSSLATDVLTMVERDDGSLQWAIKGKPLYFWAGDTKRGDIAGHDISNWEAALAPSL